MSYKTFVKGKIIETTGGDYNIYAKENIVFTSAKTITEIGVENGVTYGEPKKAPAISKYKKIFNIKWMCAEMENEISATRTGSKVSILVRTRHYESGEKIRLKIKEIDDKEINGKVRELTFTGIVNEEGFAELKEQVEIEN